MESGQAEPPVTSTLASRPSSFICWSILAVFGASSVMTTLSTPAALNLVSCGVEVGVGLADVLDELDRWRRSS